MARACKPEALKGIRIRDTMTKERDIKKITKDQNLTLRQKIKLLKEMPGTSFADACPAAWKKRCAEVEARSPGFTERVKYLDRHFGRPSADTEVLLAAQEDSIHAAKVRKRVAKTTREYADRHAAEKIEELIARVLGIATVPGSKIADFSFIPSHSDDR